MHIVYPQKRYLGQALGDLMKMFTDLYLRQYLTNSFDHNHKIYKIDNARKIQLHDFSVTQVLCALRKWKKVLKGKNKF